MNMYKVIADSGSTKTDWVIVDENSAIVDRIRTVGFNPYFQSSEFIFNEVSRAFSKVSIDMENVTEVHYYGAGCSSKENNHIVEAGLATQFNNAKVQINHDLVAAARCSLGDADGIACIIGTGSNSCVWQGQEVISNIPSHGYIFGDEGSGSFLGIELLKLVLEGKLSDEVKRKFDKEYKLSEEQILNSTYKEKDPNVFLANFAKFYSDNLDVPLLRGIVYQGFDNFFKKRIVPYQNYKSLDLGFVGSIAFYYSEILTEVAEAYGCTIKNIYQCPIDGLLDYHLEIKLLKAI